MKLAGKKPILIGVSAENHEKLKRAAAIELRPVSQFVMFYAVRAAEKIIGTTSDCK